MSAYRTLHPICAFPLYRPSWAIWESTSYTFKIVHGSLSKTSRSPRVEYFSHRLYLVGDFSFQLFVISLYPSVCSPSPSLSPRHHSRPQRYLVSISALPLSQRYLLHIPVMSSRRQAFAHYRIQLYDALPNHSLIIFHSAVLSISLFLPLSHSTPLSLYLFLSLFLSPSACAFSSRCISLSFSLCLSFTRWTAISFLLSSSSALSSLEFLQFFWFPSTQGRRNERAGAKNKNKNVKPQESAARSGKRPKPVKNRPFKKQKRNLRLTRTKNGFPNTILLFFLVCAYMHICFAARNSRKRTKFFKIIFYI